MKPEQAGDICHTVANIIDVATELSPKAKVPGDLAAMGLHAVCEILEDHLEEKERKAATDKEEMK